MLRFRLFVLAISVFNVGAVHERPARGMLMDRILPGKYGKGSLVPPGAS